jgi:hypothetical protein
VKRTNWSGRIESSRKSTVSEIWGKNLEIENATENPSSHSTAAHTFVNDELNHSEWFSKKNYVLGEDNQRGWIFLTQSPLKVTFKNRIKSSKWKQSVKEALIFVLLWDNVEHSVGQEDTWLDGPRFWRCKGEISTRCCVSLSQDRSSRSYSKLLIVFWNHAMFCQNIHDFLRSFNLWFSSSAITWATSHLSISIIAPSFQNSRSFWVRSDPARFESRIHDATKSPQDLMMDIWCPICLSRFEWITLMRFTFFGRPCTIESHEHLISISAVNEHWIRLTSDKSREVEVVQIATVLVQHLSPSARCCSIKYIRFRGHG